MRDTGTSGNYNPPPPVAPQNVAPANPNLRTDPPLR
jgi:hypothetical protein